RPVCRSWALRDGHAPRWCTNFVQVSNTVQPRGVLVLLDRAIRRVTRGTVSALVPWALNRWFRAFARPGNGYQQGSLRCDMYAMKIITAIVRPFKLDEMRHAIAQL